MPLGLNGSLDELYVDSTRLPRREELFATATGYTNAPLGVEAGAGGASQHGGCREHDAPQRLENGPLFHQAWRTGGTRQRGNDIARSRGADGGGRVCATGDSPQHARLG